MTVRRTFATWGLLAAGLVTGAAATAPAQDTTARRDSLRIKQDSARRDSLRRADSLRRVSQRRISLQKDRGEVSLRRTRTTRTSRADSIARLDSIARADSIARTDSIARADSIAMQMRRDSLARIDSLRIDSLRNDSLAREKARADSIANLERMRADSIRADSIARATPPPPVVDTTTEQYRTPRRRSLGGNWYFGVAAGRSSPAGDFEDLGYEGGFNVTVPIGWHRPQSLFGLRLDLGYDQFNGAETILPGTGGSPLILSDEDPRVLSAVLNATLHLPLNSSRTFSVYGVGGGGLWSFRNFGQTSGLSALLGNDVIDPQDEAIERTKNKFGWNAGAGFSFGVGRAALFLETRWVSVMADRDDDLDFSEFFGDRSKHVHWMPLILGVTFR